MAEYRFVPDEFNVPTRVAGNIYPTYLHIDQDLGDDDPASTTSLFYNIRQVVGVSYVKKITRYQIEFEIGLMFDYATVLGLVDDEVVAEYPPPAP